MAKYEERAGGSMKTKKPQCWNTEASGNEINFGEEIVMSDISTAVAKSNVIQLEPRDCGDSVAAVDSERVNLDLDNNREFIELLFAEDAPSIDSLIALRNKLWDAGLSPSMDLFTNMVEWSVLVGIKLRDEHSAYGPVSDFLGAEILGGPSQPDLLVDGVIPVEVKVGAFNASALRQLQRYMAKYKSDTGVAVGRELLVQLPSNVRFIKICFSDESRRYEVVASEEGGAK
ncbi:hypothetical protein [Pseudomonas antarctica]|uniref:hypothetical protein n=1 Tax=Pseudomonas antarctica TaxID=219572 RepID=UPI003F7550AB